MSHRHRSRSKHHASDPVQTETDLKLHMLADPLKLKPIEKQIVVEKIDEGDETIMENRSKSSNSSESFVSSNSSSSRSSRKRRSHDKASKRHKELDTIIEELNRKSKVSNRSGSSSSSTSKSSRSSKSSNSSKTSTSSVTMVSKVSEKSKKSLPKVHKEPEPIPRYRTEREKKIYKMELFYTLQKYKKEGRTLSREYGPSASLEDMEDEVMIQEKIDAKEETTLLCKEGMKKITAFVVDKNEQYDPFGIKLKGWDKLIKHEVNTGKYNMVLSKLYDKYSCYVSRMEPEFVFIWMFFGSALVFHYSQKYIEENNLSEIAKAHPELVTKIQETVAGVINSKASDQLNPVQSTQKKPGMGKRELYEQMKKDMLNDDIEINDLEVSIDNDSQQDIDNTINEMLMKDNTHFVAPPGKMNVGGSKTVNPSGIINRRPTSLTNIMANTSRTGGISLSETPMVTMETVDSMSVLEDTPTGRAVQRSRLKIGRK